jgi:hypothetical protein
MNKNGNGRKNRTENFRKKAKRDRGLKEGGKEWKQEGGEKKRV